MQLQGTIKLSPQLRFDMSLQSWLHYNCLFNCDSIFLWTPVQFNNCLHSWELRDSILSPQLRFNLSTHSWFQYCLFKWDSNFLHKYTIQYCLLSWDSIMSPDSPQLRFKLSPHWLVSILSFQVSGTGFVDFCSFLSNAIQRSIVRRMTQQNCYFT